RRGPLHVRLGHPPQRPRVRRGGRSDEARGPGGVGEAKAAGRERGAVLRSIARQRPATTRWRPAAGLTVDAAARGGGTAGQARLAARPPRTTMGRGRYVQAGPGVARVQARNPALGPRAAGGDAAPLPGYGGGGGRGRGAGGAG